MIELEIEERFDRDRGKKKHSWRACAITFFSRQAVLPGRTPDSLPGL